MDRRFSVLYVDDEQSNLDIFKDTFRREYNIFTAISAKEGLQILDKEKIDLILTDQRMPEMNGVEFLKNALNKYPELNRILVTAYTDFDAIKNAINEAQIFQYIQKPWTEKELRNVIEQGLEVYRLKRENERLTQELKEKNKELETINNELVEFEELKADFLSIISHEIRTPLNGLVGPLKMLKNELESESELVEGLMGILEASVKKLEQFSISSLNITMLKAKKYELNLETIDVSELIQKTYDIFQINIIDKNINFSYEITSKEINADKELLKICIKGLIDNAIKFSNEDDSIDLKTYYENNFTVLEIKDSGPGFDKEYLEKFLFDYFLYSDKLKNKSIGLDLALIKHIMDIHKGQIKVENNKNEPGARVKLFFR